MQKPNLEVLNYTSDGDLLVVNAARCSFDKHHEAFDGTLDRKLINYLAEHGHLLPFRHPVATLRINCPIFVLRQLGKHQVGFSWSEVSRRYITGDPEFWMPKEFRTRPKNIKQGSESKDWTEDDVNFIWDVYHEQHATAKKMYNVLLDKGVAPEQARAVLPQSMYTTCVVTGTLLGWHHLYKLRTEEHTQRETQEYAREIGEIMTKLFPKSWEALCKH
jgi:thymidylate synthase (FAD)